MRNKLRLFAALIVLCCLIIKLTANFRLAAEQFCRFDVNNALGNEISNRLLNFTIENRELQREICNYSSDNGRIKSIFVDAYTVSKVSAMITSQLTETIMRFGESGFGIPIGNITGLMIFSGRGPKIKIKTVPLGNIACDTESVFISAGINQTLFKLVLKINCAYETLVPFTCEAGELSFTYTLCETLIIGDVPNLYLQS